MLNINLKMRRLVIISLFGILNMNVSFASKSIISLFDFEKKPSIDFYDNFFKNNGYEVSNDTMSIYGEPYHSREYSIHQAGHSKFIINISYTPKSRQIENVHILCNPLFDDPVNKEAFMPDLMSFYTDIITKYGLPDYANGEESEVLIGENDSAKIRQYFEVPTTYDVSWFNNKDYYLSFILSRACWQFKCSINYKRIRELSRKEYKILDAEKELLAQKRETREKILIIILIIAGCIFFCFIGRLIHKDYIKSKEWEKAKQEADAEQRNKKQKEVDVKHEEYKKYLIDKYGAITRIISNNLYDKDFIMNYDEIFIFEKNKKVIFDKKEYDFAEILSCSMYDENHNGTSPTQVTRTKTGSMLGRAVVGGLTLGVAGAVVGAMTAKTESTSSTANSDYIASYIVKIGVKSIEKPTLTLKFGSDKSKAEEVYALIQAIIAMK